MSLRGAQPADSSTHRPSHRWIHLSAGVPVYRLTLVMVSPAVCLQLSGLWHGFSQGNIPKELGIFDLVLEVSAPFHCPDSLILVFHFETISSFCLITLQWTLPSEGVYLMSGAYSSTGWTLVYHVKSSRLDSYTAEPRSGFHTCNPALRK